jgi:hypothetical protein
MGKTKEGNHKAMLNASLMANNTTKCQIGKKNFPRVK